jgi:hypothetical protein
VGGRLSGGLGGGRATGERRFDTPRADAARAGARDADPDPAGGLRCADGEDGVGVRVRPSDACVACSSRLLELDLEDEPPAAVREEVVDGLGSLAAGAG